MLKQEDLEQQTIEAFKAWRKDRTLTTQQLINDTWCDIREPQWNKPTPYRIKPEPIPQGVFWNNVLGEFYDANGGSPREGGSYPAFRAKWFSRSAEFPKYADRPRPVLQMIPLGPEDVVPGTVFKHSSWKVGFRYAEPCQAGIDINDRIYSGTDLMQDGWSYKTPAMTDWQPCSKPAP